MYDLAIDGYNKIVDDQGSAVDRPLLAILTLPHGQAPVALARLGKAGLIVQTRRCASSSFRACDRIVGRWALTLELCERTAGRSD